MDCLSSRDFWRWRLVIADEALIHLLPTHMNDKVPAKALPARVGQVVSDAGIHVTI